MVMILLKVKIHTEKELGERRTARDSKVLYF